VQDTGHEASRLNSRYWRKRLGTLEFSEANIIVLSNTMELFKEPFIFAI